MRMSHFLLAGLLVGFSIAAPVGPTGLLCIRRTLAAGMRVGVCTGLGAATVNVVYGALILGGLADAAWADGARRTLNALAGCLLLFIAARTFAGRRGAAVQDAPRPLAAYASTLVFNAFNPMSPALTFALLSPLTAAAALSAREAAALLFGMFAAASAWWVCLSAAVALLRARLTPAMLIGVNRLAGVLLTLYGLVTLARSARM